MTLAMGVVALCLVTSAAILVPARRLVERSRPATVVPLLAIGALVNAASLVLLLTLLGVAVLGRSPEIAAAAGWSVDRLEAALPEPQLVGVAAAVAAAVLLARTAWRAGTIATSLARSDLLTRRLRAGGGPVVMVDSDDCQADAFTLAGVKGCVVISRQLFDVLGPRERKMLTGHELSHLRHRHHLYLHAADLATAANPIMTRLGEAVRLGVERWADEDAVTMLAGDRDAAAAALATTALTRARVRRGTAVRQGPVHRAVAVLGVASSHVSVRAHALLAPAPQRSPLLLCLAALLAVTFGATVAASLDIHQGFEHAEILRQLLHR